MENFDNIFTTAPAEETQQPQTASRDDFDVDAWAQKKQAERDGLFIQLDERATEVSISTDAFVDYLNVQSRFLRMGTSNALLVAAQCPEATQLATFDEWHQQNASILSGEKAIAMFEMGDTYTRSDGNEGRHTNVKKVFDISQTSAEKPPAAPAYNITDLLKAVHANSGVKVEMVDQLPDNRVALYQSENNTVFVRRGMDGDSLFIALTTELTRASMLKDGVAPKEANAASRTASELLCRKYGVDTSKHYNVEQLRIGYFGEGSKAIRDGLGMARKAAESVSYNMEKTLNPQQRTDRSNGAR